MDLCYMTSELKLLRIHTYFVYKVCPFRLSRLNIGKVVRGSGKLDGSFAEHHLCLKKKKYTGHLKQHGLLLESEG